jgi:excisionase family DNA binding protein
MLEASFDQLPQAVSQLYSKLENIERLLLDGSNQTSPEPEQPLTIKEAGELLKLSIPTLYGYVQRAEIPVCKRGKRLYFSKQELLQWIKDGRKKTHVETAKEAEQYLTQKKGGKSC